MTEPASSVSIWMRPTRPRRDRPTLSRERITAAAVALLDDVGIEGLTMRALADRLDTGPTTLYWHVDSKIDILDMALDAVIGEIDVPATPTSAEWRGDLRRVCADWHATLLRHPWTATLIGRPIVGPNSLRLLEYVTATLTATGLGGQVAAAVWACYSHVTGAAAAEATFPHDDAAAAHEAEHIADHAEQYPTLAANTELIVDRPWAPTILAGLDFLLDGIASAAGRGRRG